jgi:hypothetical protein
MIREMIRRGVGRLALAALLLSATASCRDPSTPVGPSRPELRAAPPEGPAEAVIGAALAEARRDRRTLVVFVSAAWCEPCERFQEALESGALDPYFPNLRLLKFDHDRDAQRLEAAGYAGAYLPRFVPQPDGRGSTRRIEGARKGVDAVSSIGPRLQALMGMTPPRTDARP